jgi:sialic acid synthase SpsE
VTLFPGIEGCAVIADVAQSHDGHLDVVHGDIDAIAEAGAHGVKFQTHIAAAEFFEDGTPVPPRHLLAEYSYDLYCFCGSLRDNSCEEICDTHHCVSWESENI